MDNRFYVQPKEDSTLQDRAGRRQVVYDLLVESSHGWQLFFLPLSLELKNVNGKTENRREQFLMVLLMY